MLFQYNANDQLVKMTQNRVDEYHEQAEQLVTLYEYDGRNLVTKVVQATGSQELYVYDGNGNIVSKTDGDNYVTEYTYNSLDLVTHISYNGTKEVSYQYNKVGELVRMDDWLGTTTFQLDLLNQLTKVTDHKGNVVEYTYDAVGNQTSITYPDETEVSKTYDALGQLLQVTDAENQNYTYTYDDAGNVTKLVYPNGWVEDYTYDAEGNLLKTVDTDPFHNNKVSTKYQYTYDAEGNLISEYKRDTTAGNKALTTTYAYDALNRLVSAHEEGVGVNTTRTYQYDTLGNLIREEQDGCVEYKYNGAHLDESTKCGTIPNSIGTSYWEYTYDNRGNLVSRDKYTRTTSGMAWQNEAAYTYDETNRMVSGKNEPADSGIYTYNGLGMRVGRELIMKDNTHGYTDFHDLTPSVDTGIDKPEVVVESYVIDYTSAIFDPLTMDEDGGFSYRYVYGLNTLSVKITSEGTNWWGQHVTTDILKDYYHQDRLGSTTNLTDKFGRVVGRADYNEWGEMTYREALTITSSYRRIYPQSSYTGHDWDDVLGMYYAKARFDSAEDKRFVSMDPVKGQIIEPLSLVAYVYCVDNPLRWVDPLGLIPGRANMVNTMVSDTGNGQRQTQKGTVDKSVLLEKKAELQKSEQVSASEKAKGNSKTIAKPAVTHKSALIPVVWFEYFLPTLPFILIPIYELDSFDGCLPSEGLAAFDRLCDDIFAAFIQYGIDGIDSIGSQSQLGALMDLAIGVAVDTIYCTVEKISASDYFSSLRCEALAKIQANQEESRKSWCVYVLLDQRPSGTVIYVGMTSNANKREDQHRRSPKVQLYPNLALFVLRSGLKDRTEARVCEQVYMTVFFPEIYNAHLNKVRSISQYKLSHNQTKLTALLNFVGDVAENELLSAMEEVEF